MWVSGNSHMSLVEMQNGAATVKNSLAVLQNIKQSPM